MLKTGTVVRGENEESDGWTVLGLLGQGSCCEVYKVAMLNKPQCKAALKIYKDGDNYVTAHDSEALLLNLVLRVNGPCQNIVTTLWDLDHEEQPCLIQELLDLDLRHIIAHGQGEGLSVYLLQKLLLDVLRGLEHLHKSGFIHADIKPGNLMWSPRDGCLKIIDFSLSYHVQDQQVSRIQSQAHRAPESEMWSQKLATDNPHQELAAHNLHQKLEAHNPPVTTSSALNTQPFQAVQCTCGRLNPETQTAIGEQKFADSATASNSGTHHNAFVHETSSNLSCDHCTASHQPPSCDRQPSCDQQPPSCDSQPSQPLTCVKCKQKAAGISEILPPGMVLVGAGVMAACDRPSKPADMWSVGCIVGEMLTGAKIFTAKKLVEIQQQQQEGRLLSDCIQRAVEEVFRPQSHRTDIEDPQASQLKDLTTQLLCVDPKTRLAAEQALKHPFFSNTFTPTFSDLCVLCSPVLRILNVVEDEDLTSENKYQDLKEDLATGFKEYGEISSSVLPREGEGRGKVYVEYRDWENAQAAFAGLCRRHFNGHTIILTYFPPLDYRNKRFY